MTISQAIIKWLKTFSPDELRKMKQIDTDLMHGNVDYVLVKEPIVNVKKYISGLEVHTEHYQFRGRLSSLTNQDCIENGAWFEALTEWIAEQNRKKKFPELEQGQVQEVGISTPFFVGRNGADEAIYQMTIYIKFMKEA